MLPVTSPNVPFKRAGLHRHGGMRWSRDGWLLAMFSVAAVFLLYRGITYANRTPGVTTVISTTQVLRKDSAVYTELVIDKDGKSQSTTVTSGESGVKVTVVEGGKGSLASLRQQEAAAASQQQQQQYPGLPKDFDAQVSWACAPLSIRSRGRAARSRCAACAETDLSAFPCAEPCPGGCLHPRYLLLPGPRPPARWLCFLPPAHQPACW
jgi:hypothetical protein